MLLEFDRFYEFSENCEIYSVPIVAVFLRDRDGLSHIAHTWSSDHPSELGSGLVGIYHFTERCLFAGQTFWVTDGGI